MQTTSPETEIPNAGATPALMESAPSAGEPPNNPEPSPPEPLPARGMTDNEFMETIPMPEPPAEIGLPVLTEKMLATARALGLDQTRWTPDKILQMQMLDHLSTIPITVHVLLTSGLDSIEQCQKAYKVLGKLGENPDVSSDVRVAAYKAIAETVKAHQAMSAHALSLAKETDVKKNSEKPKVLPPSLALQINCPPGAPAPSVQVSSVSSGQERPEHGEE